MRRAIETYKECYNLAEQYGYSNLQFDVEKISDLSKVVNQRVQMLNLKAAWNNPDDIDKRMRYYQGLIDMERRAYVWAGLSSRRRLDDHAAPLSLSRPLRS